MSTRVAGFDLSDLTSLRTKAEIYQRDPFLREGAYHFSDAVEDYVPGAIFKIALVMIRPDCLILNRSSRLVDLIEKYGFSIVTHRVKSISPVAMRVLWAHPFCHATTERLHLLDRLFAIAPSVIIIAWDKLGHAQWPASVDLSLRKGSAYPINRTGSDMRTILGSPNRVLSLFHISDEPLDILRDLAILFSAAERACLFRQITSFPGNNTLALESLAKTLNDIEASVAPMSRCDRSGSLDHDKGGCSRSFDCPLDRLTNSWESVEDSTLETIDQKFASTGCTCTASRWKNILLASEMIRTSDPTALDNIIGRPTLRWSRP